MRNTPVFQQATTDYASELQHLLRKVCDKLTDMHSDLGVVHTQASELNVFTIPLYTHYVIQTAMPLVDSIVVSEYTAGEATGTVFIFNEEDLSKLDEFDV